MGALKVVFIVFALAVALPRIFRNIQPHIFPVHTYNHTPGPCYQIKGIGEGSEDIQLLPSGRALVSTGLRFLFDVTRPPYRDRKGYMKVIDARTPQDSARVVEIDTRGGKLDLENFNPHGINIWTDPRGAVFVFVVNHHLPSDTESVERFEWLEKNSTLRHLSTVTDDNMHLINDVVATGENSFYFTNFLYNRNRLAAQWERALILRWGSVGYFDGTSVTLVEEGLNVPNGINMSPDGKIVYLAEGGEQALRTYKRMPDNSLQLIEVHPLYTSPDNIDVDDDGQHIWIGCHPWRPALKRHFEDPYNNISPSQVLRLEVEGGHVTKMQEVLADEGHLISGSTVAVHDKDTSRLLVGSVVAQAVYCDIKYID